MMRFSIFVLVTTLSFFNNTWAETITFNNLTGSRFKGKPSDLQLFSINDIEAFKDRRFIYEGVAPQGIRWRLGFVQVRTGRYTFKRPQTYKIHFLIKDHKGTVLLKRVATFDEDYRGKSPSYVTREIGGAHLIFFEKDIPIKYGSVDYWISEITWGESDHSYFYKDPDKVAFTLDSQLKAFEKEGLSKERDKQSLVVSFKEPVNTSASLKIDGDRTLYLLAKTDYSTAIRTSQEWNTALTSLCERDSQCPVNYKQELGNGQNIHQEELQKKCETNGCAFLIEPTPESSTRNPCDKYWTKIKINLCEVTGSLFSSKKCSRAEVKCKRVNPSSYGYERSNLSDSLLVFTWESFGISNLRYIQFEINGKSFELEH